MFAPFSAPANANAPLLLMKACAGKQLGFAVDSSRPESLRDQVSHGLREAIRNGILKVGESLPSCGRSLGLAG